MTLVMIPAISGPVSAATVTANLNVSATVVPVCTVSTAPINFGVVILGSSTNANGSVDVTCTGGVSYNIALNAGNQYDLGARWISDGATSPNYVRYDLYQDLSLAIPWGDSGFGNTFPSASPLVDIGSGVLQSHTVYGSIPGIGTSQPPGDYADIVLVTVHY